MTVQSTQVWLWRSNNRKGPVVLRKNYDTVATAIISEIQSRSSGEIDLYELIDQIRRVLSSGFHGNIDWYVLHVKLDLEARGIIKTSVNRDCVQTIRLNKKHSVLR